MIQAKVRGDPIRTHIKNNTDDGWAGGYSDRSLCDFVETFSNGTKILSSFDETIFTFQFFLFQNFSSFIFVSLLFNFR